MDFKRLEHQVNHIASTMNAQYSIAIETSDGQIYINAEEQVPSASLIKIPIMIEAFRQARAGRLDLQRRYRVPSTKRVGGTGIVQYMSQETTWSLRDLISLMIIVSDNTATNFIIDILGMENVNALAQKLDCTKTVLARKMMDLEARSKGVDNFTSAADMVVFLKEIIHGTTLDEEGRRAAFHTLTCQQLNIKLSVDAPKALSPNIELAHKTGELPGIEHDVGIFRINGNSAYVAVLTWGLAENDSGRRFIANIGQLVFNYLRTQAFQQIPKH
jgi:beta-lactamase class A